MTNTVDQVANQVVGVSQQLQNPWELMVFLVVVGIVFFCAFGWAVYKLTMRQFRESDSARQQLIDTEKAHSQALEKIREEHGTELKEMVRDNHEVMRQLESAINSNTTAVNRLADRLAGSGRVANG
jgi:hypothetical protein